MVGKLIKTGEGLYNLLYVTDNTVAEHNEAFDGKLSLKNCLAIELGYDLEELAANAADNYDSSGNWHVAYELYKLGFQRALEILGDKKFSEEDMINAYREGTNDGALYESLCDHDSHDCEEADEFSKSEYGDFIQSIQQKEWDVEVEMETNCPYDYTSRCTQGRCDCKKPKLDADGCLILKIIDDE